MSKSEHWIERYMHTLDGTYKHDLDGGVNMYTLYYYILGCSCDGVAYKDVCGNANNICDYLDCLI